MRNLGKFAGKLLAVLALAACLAPATAFADEAVSLGGGDIAAGNQVYLGAYDSNPIAWDVEGNSGSLAVHSHYILFTTQIHDNSDVDEVPRLTLETSQLYTSSGLWFKTFPEFKSEAFSDAERSMVGDFALSSDFGGATFPDGTGEWYWINEEVYKGGGDWHGTAVSPYGVRYARYVSLEHGVRPASSFGLASVLFSSAAEGGKSGAAGAGEFSTLSGTSSVSAWKFTLKDSSRAVSASATGTTAAEGYSSWTVPITFSGGGTAANDYVSAILCKADGTPIYYGTVANAKAEGTQDMTMPTGLAKGVYTLKVFSEQRNGDFKTDYASAFASIQLTVEEPAPVEYTIAVSANPENGGTVSGGKTYAEGESVTLTAAPAAGYDFVSWTENGAVVSMQASYKFAAAANRALVANFELQTFTVTYKVENGTWSDGTTGEKTETVAYGGTPSQVPTGMKPAEGHGGGSWDADPAAATVTAAAEFTYSFALNEYEVKASASPDKGGTVSGAGTYAHGQSVKLEAAPNEHYDFVNWTDDAGNPVSTDTTYAFTAEGDCELTANFELQTFTVKFVDWDGAELQSGEVAYGETPSYAGAEPTRKADADNTYKFAGWTPAIAEVTGEATYTATYEATPIQKATLTFDLGGGTLDGKTGTITVVANVGETINLPGAPTREGYTFKCWKGSEYAAGAEYKVEGDHDFTAEWEKNSSSKPAIPVTGDPLTGMLGPIAALAAASALCLAFSGTALRRRDRTYSGKHVRK